MSAEVKRVDEANLAYLVALSLRGIAPRAPGNYDSDAASLEAGFSTEGPSMAQQSQAKEADINFIVKQFGITGQLPTNVRAPTFADFADVVFDFQSAQNAIALANQSFMQMPADVRSRFNNDPQRFVEFCSDADNLPEMRKLGLAPPAPIVAPASTAPAASGSSGGES